MSVVTKRFPIPLYNGKEVVIEGEFPLSQEDWDQFMTVLALYKLTLVQAVPDADA